MQRAVLNTISRQHFFRRVYEIAEGWGKASQICRVTERTIRDWARGVHTPPLKAIENLSQSLGIKKPKIVEIQEDTLLKRAAGRRGALVRMARYGNPGTPDGRRKGGMHALERLKLRGDQRFIFRKVILRPPLSPELSEMVGIVLGDGGISNHQVTVSLNRKTDAHYAHYIGHLFFRLFGLETSFIIRSEHNTVNAVVSSVELVEYLCKLGLVRGDKIRQKVDIPRWVKRRPPLLRGCIRGLFDTDGSIYLDTHRTSKKIYKHIGMTFTSYSPPLLYSFEQALNQWGFHPSIKSQHSVFLRREKEIFRYFNEIGTHNPKHKERFENFVIVRGGVPKRS